MALWLRSLQLKSALASALLVIFSSSLPAHAANVQSPIQLPFNDGATTGPDGPWNFLSLPVGPDTQSKVNFHIMAGQPQSILVAGDNCTITSASCLNATADGYYKSNLTGGSIETTPDGQQLADVTSSAYDWDRFYSPLVNLSGSGRYTLRSFDLGVPNQKYDDIAVYLSSDLRTYIGSKSYRPLSMLSLAGANQDLNKSQLVGGGPANSTTIADINTKAGVAHSWGLHYGAAGFGQKGSLYMGGYDARRIIEKPISNDMSADGFDLANLTIETSSGDSPWNGSGRTQPNTSFVTSPVKNMHALPHTPYILLPAQTILMLTQNLPVYRDGETGLLLWNTTDPLYDRLMSSPTFLKFTFSAASSGSVRIPLAVLRLYLTSPIKDKPTPYFPVKACDYWCVLGRAFLQSAFYMEAFTSTTGTLFLAQAPGPSVGGGADKTPPAATSCDPAFPTVGLLSSPPTLEDTWIDHLKPLGSQSSSRPAVSGVASSSASSDSTGDDGSLSPGAKGGIAVAVIVPVAASIIVALLLFLRRQRRRQQQRQAQQQENERVQAFQEKQLSNNSTPSSSTSTSA